MKRSRLASLVLMCAMSVACMSAIADAPRAIGPAASPSVTSIEPYRTKLFNLLSKKPNIVGGKVYYQADFAKQFDALLALSSLAKADKTQVPVNKRLLSGPTEEPSLLTDPATGTQWLLYDACQAHRCDEVSLLLLFDPAKRRMVGKLNLDKQSELLGAPTAGERRMLDRAPNARRVVAIAGAPLEQIMASLIDYKTFRLSSEGFDHVVAPYCKRTDLQQYEYGVDAEYRCDVVTGISEMKISTRENAAALKNYVMYIQVVVGPDRYALLKSKIQGKLGKPKKSGKDFVRYVYTGDKELNKHGTPVISLAREDEQTVVFEVGLEQGP